MGYDKYGIKYYLDYKDKQYITNKIHYYSQIVEKKPNKSREWFKISKFWFKKSQNAKSEKYKTIYKTIAKRCYALYVQNKPSNDDRSEVQKWSDFIKSIF
jgi:hypothetical protein